MNIKQLPKQEYLHECFIYDQLTGSLTWRVRPREHFRTERGWKIFNTRSSGKSALSLNKRPDGTAYYYVGVNNQSYRAHRIIACMMLGNIGQSEVDHRDNVGTNNRWDNLRLATSSQNKMNTRVRRDSKSGYKGVSFHKGIGNRKGSWMYSIKLDGMIRKKLGFKTPTEAFKAREIVLESLHGEFSKNHTIHG